MRLLPLLAISSLLAGGGHAQGADPGPGTTVEARAADRLIAAAAVHPAVRRLIDLDAGLAAAVPAFEQATNTLVVIERRPLALVLISPWWHLRAQADGAPRLALLDRSEHPGLILRELEGLPAGFERLVERLGQAASTAVLTTIESHAAPGPGSEIAVLTDGMRAIPVDPERLGDLRRPVPVAVRVESPLARRVAFVADRMPLSEAVMALAQLAKADAIMPDTSPAQEQVRITVSVKDRRIIDILSDIGMVSRSEVDCQDGLQERIQGEGAKMFIVKPSWPSSTVDAGFDPGSRPLLDRIASAATAPGTDAERMLAHLRGQLPPLPLRPLITVRPMQASP